MPSGAMPPFKHIKNPRMTARDGAILGPVSFGIVEL